MDQHELLIATHNPGKVAEFAEMLHEFKVRWLTLQDLAIDSEIAEEGASLLENARLKAEGYALLSGLLTLADDTGLEIDALDGAPGIYPARYGGPGLTPVERCQLILRQMHNVPQHQRSARFRCVIALAGQQGMLAHSEGVLEGEIAQTMVGAQGFGYDPIFYLPNLGKTVAQLSSNDKHRVSHRGQAIRSIAPLLRQLIDATDANSRQH